MTVLPIFFITKACDDNMAQVDLNRRKIEATLIRKDRYEFHWHADQKYIEKIIAWYASTSDECGEYPMGTCLFYSSWEPKEV